MQSRWVLFLERLYNMDQLKDRLLLMRAAREAGDSRLEELTKEEVFRHRAAVF